MHLAFRLRKFASIAEEDSRSRKILRGKMAAVAFEVSIHLPSFRNAVGLTKSVA